MDARMRNEGFEIIESPLEAERISLAFSQATAPGRLRQRRKSKGKLLLFYIIRMYSALRQIYIFYAIGGSV